MVKNEIPLLEKDDKWNAFIRHMVTGGIAGAVSRTTTAPLDRLKIFFQVSEHPPKIGRIFRDLVSEGGLSGMWRGNLLNVMKSTPKSAVRFACYDNVKIHLKGDEKREMELWERFVAGSVAGVVSQTILYPFDMLKVRMALRTTGQYKGIVDAALKIYKREGFRAFSRGYVANAIGIIPNSGIDLAGYETLKSILEKPDKKPTTFQLFVVGSFAAFVAQITTYPLAMVCTVMQANDEDQATKLKGLRSIILEIWQRDGITGFYRGLFPNMLKFVPLTGITYIVYEYCNTIFGIKMT